MSYSNLNTPVVYISCNIDFFKNTSYNCISSVIDHK